MSVSIFGLGYVGSVMAACLAQRGVSVIGVDVNADKIKNLNTGKTPIVEPKMQDLVAEAMKNNRISATSDVAEAVSKTDVSFVCVGTPSLPNGKLDLKAMSHVCEQIGAAIAKKSTPHVVVVRSTMLPGSTEQTVIPALEKTSGKKAQKDFYVCVNPEFLREGSAVNDYFNPPMTVIGCAQKEHAAVLDKLYEGLPGPIFHTNIASAEMVKYACNAFHALKVAFANEIGTMGREMGVDVDAVADIFCSDTKLNASAAYLRPGFAFGGSCLPKDVRALTYRSKELDLELPLLGSILPSNDRHIDRAVDQILDTKGRKVGFLGLSFKANTDDLRESPNVLVVKRLLGEGCQVKIWDNNVSLGVLIGSNRQFITDTIPHIGDLLVGSLEDVIANCDTVVLGTSELKEASVRAKMKPGQNFVNLVKLRAVEAAIPVNA